MFMLLSSHCMDLTARSVVQTNVSLFPSERGCALPVICRPDTRKWESKLSLNELLVRVQINMMFTKGNDL